MKAKNLKEGKFSNAFSLLLLLISFGFLLEGCYPGDPLTPAETDVISTFYEPDADFSSKLTYAIPDSVVYFDRDGNVTNNSGRYDKQILERIESNLNEMGYQEESNPENANVLVTAGITTTTWVSGGCYPSYGWWYPYYGWCYPVAYTYNTGSLIITMAEPNSEKEAVVIWFAGINGIIDDSNASISNRLNQNIDQAFNQSEYLANGK